jgi:alcohol dehydrogenase
VPAVEAGARELKRLGADAVVAVGGGSAIVTARAASVLLAESGDLKRLCTSRDERGELVSPRLLAPKLPHLVVPTTPTTATVKAGGAVFDPADGTRLALFDPKTRAHAIFIHPELVSSAPRELVVTASLNTFVSAVEGLTSRSGHPISDALLMHALRLLALHLPDQVHGGADPAARGELMFAAVLCGQGTNYTGAGIATVLGHAVGARQAVENGIAKAIMVPHALAFNAAAAEPGLLKTASSLCEMRAQSEPLAASVINALEEIFRKRGIPRRLREIGVPREVLPDIAAGAMGDWFLRDNPRPVEDVSQLQQVLEAAW